MSNQNIPCTNPSVCKVKSHRPGTDALCKRLNRKGGSESKTSGLTAAIKPSGGYDTSTEDAIAEAQYLADEQNEIKLKASMKRFMNSSSARSFNPDSFRANVSRNSYVAEVDKPFSSSGVRFERGDKVYIDAKTRRASPFETKSKHTVQDSINDVKRVALEDQMKQFADSELGDQFYRLSVADVNGRQYSATVEHSFIKDDVHYEAGDKVFIDADSADISRESPETRRQRIATEGLIHQYNRAALEGDLKEFKETELGDQFSDMEISDVEKRQYSATVVEAFQMGRDRFSVGDKVFIGADSVEITKRS